MFNQIIGAQASMIYYSLTMIIKNFGILINSFFVNVNKSGIRLYNEFSLQHELGIFLRSRFPGYFVEFERNVSFFGVRETVKKEIDVVIYNADKTEKCAIELKYPRKGEYPEQMYAFIKDIKFMEQLKYNHGFETYVLTIVDDSLFYSRGAKGTAKAAGIYSYFRNPTNTVGGRINKPTGVPKDSKFISLMNSYSFSWIDVSWSDGENLPNGTQKYYYIVL